MKPWAGGWSAVPSPPNPLREHFCSYISGSALATRAVVSGVTRWGERYRPTAILDLSTPRGSMSMSLTSCSAYGLCSTPFATTNISPAPMFTQPSRKSILKLPSDAHKIQAYCMDSDALGQGVTSPHVEPLLSGTMSGILRGT